MPRYQFHLCRPNTAPILHRVCECADLRAALAEAQGAARSLIAKHVRRKPEPLHGSVDIQDERHQLIARVLLADVVRQIS